MATGHSNRSVSIVGDARENVIVTGDQNVVRTDHRRITTENTLDIAADLQSLQEFVAALGVAPKDRRKMENALEDARLEVEDDAPSKENVGEAMSRMMKYAETAADFTEKAQKFMPHLKNVANWLGDAGKVLLSSIGMG